MRDGNEILPGRKGVDILSTVTPLCGLAGFSEFLLTRGTLLELAGLEPSGQGTDQALGVGISVAETLLGVGPGANKERRLEEIQSREHLSYKQVLSKDRAVFQFFNIPLKNCFLWDSYLQPQQDRDNGEKQ